MHELLFCYGIRLFDALVILLLIGIGVAVSYLLMRRCWQAKHDKLLSDLTEAQQHVKRLQQALAEARNATIRVTCKRCATLRIRL